MVNLSNIGLNSLPAVEAVLKTQADNEEVQNFLAKAQELYNQDSEFKAEIDRVLPRKEGKKDSSVAKDHPALDGLSEQELAIVSATMRRTDDSSAQLSVDAKEKGDGKLMLYSALAIGAAAIIAIYVFRGYVARALYSLAVKIPLLGPAIERKFGAAKEVISGELPESTRRTIVQDILDLERLTGLKGESDGQFKIVRFLELVRNLNISDVKEVLNDAKNLKRLSRSY